MNEYNMLLARLQRIQSLRNIAIDTNSWYMLCKRKQADFLIKQIESRLKQIEKYQKNLN